MKINEIIINKKQQVLDNMVDGYQELLAFLHRVEHQSNDFAISARKLFTPYEINEELSELYEVKERMSQYKHASQIPLMLKILIDYFERS